MGMREGKNRGEMAMGTKDPVFQLCDVVRETAFAIHKFLGPGHLEKVYKNALVHRLRKQARGRAAISVVRL